MTNRDLDKSTSQDRPLRRQLMSCDEVQATEFEEIWHRAETQFELNRRSRPAQELLRHTKLAGWSVAAAALVFLSFFVTTQFNSQKAPEAFEEPLLSVIISTEDELFSALLASTQWSAPSDRFLKKTPQMKIWGTPTLEIHSPDSTEGS